MSCVQRYCSVSELKHARDGETEGAETLWEIEFTRDEERGETEPLNKAGAVAQTPASVPRSGGPGLLQCT